MRQVVLASCLALHVLIGSAASQCVGPSVTIETYGQTCAFFGQPANLSASYDPSACMLSLQLSRSQTCCNTFLSAQALLIGLRPFDPGIRSPVLVPGCVLSLFPDIVLVQPPAAGGVWNLVLPPVGVPLDLYFQGVNDYFTTIGFTHDFQASDAVRVSLGR